MINAVVVIDKRGLLEDLSLRGRQTFTHGDRCPECVQGSVYGQQHVSVLHRDHGTLKVVGSAGTVMAKTPLF
jgi:hypothetical protein